MVEDDEDEAQSMVAAHLLQELHLCLLDQRTSRPSANCTLRCSLLLPQWVSARAPPAALQIWWGQLASAGPQSRRYMSLRNLTLISAITHKPLQPFPWRPRIATMVKSSERNTGAITRKQMIPGVSRWPSAEELSHQSQRMKDTLEGHSCVEQGNYLNRDEAQLQECGNR